MPTSSPVLVSRRRSVSAAVGINPNSNSNFSRSSALHLFNSNNNNSNSSPSPKNRSRAEESKHRQEIINALKNVTIPGVTVNEEIKEGEEYTGDDDASLLAFGSAKPFAGTGNATTTMTSMNHKKVGILGLLSSANRKKCILPVATEEVQDLTEADLLLLNELDVNELAPLLTFLKQTAPEVYGELPQRFTPEVAEEIILHLIAGSDDVSGSPSARLRKRGFTTATISSAQVRSLALAVSHFAHTHQQHQQQQQHGVSFPHHNQDGSFQNDDEHESNLATNPLNRFDSQHQDQNNQSTQYYYLDEYNNNASGNNNLHLSGQQQESQQLQQQQNTETNDEKLARFEREAAEREQKMQAVLNGVKEISRKHRERAIKLRIDNKDIGDVAIQTVASPGIKVVTTTGRPPPSHAVDAVGGIKQQMKTTHGEPPLMVLRQELEDRQALADAMPRIRARVAEIMGKLSKQNHPGRNSASASRQKRPNSAATATAATNSFSVASQNHNQSSTKRTRNANVGNFFADNDHLASQENQSAGRGGRNDRDISEIARRLRMKSESVNAVAEKQHREAVEKRRAASQLRRDLVNQGVWVDVRILSMFRPPAQMKSFVASWSEFKSMIVQAVSPLPPGCVVASLSYLSGPGSRSVIDPRHPLLRPLRGFEVVRGCKTRDGTCASLTISVAIRSSGESSGLPHDFEV